MSGICQDEFTIRGDETRTKYKNCVKLKTEPRIDNEICATSVKTGKSVKGKSTGNIETVGICSNVRSINNTQNKEKP